MKKVVFIMTMLVVAMGVSFTANAQDTVDVYSTYSPTTIDSDWSVDPDSDDNNSAYYPGSPSFGIISLYSSYTDENAKYSFKKGFNLDNLDSIKISYDVENSATSGSSTEPFTFEILISEDDINYTSVGTYSGTSSDSDDIMLDNTNFASLGMNTYVKIIFTFSETITYVSGYEFIDVKLNDFSIEGYENSGSVGIDENDLSNDLEVYSFNKSVFITSNETMNANVSVYNMSGQVVNTQNMNLSNTKSEINIYDVPSGMYIVNVSNGSAVMSKKVFIHK